MCITCCVFRKITNGTRNTLQFIQLERHDPIRSHINGFAACDFQSIRDFGVMGIGDDGGEPVQNFCC